jgi:hypothetical protein
MEFNVVIFQVLAEVSMKVTALWDVAPFSVVEIDRRFRSAYCSMRLSKVCQFLPDNTA